MISPFALVSPSAKIGQNVTIEPFAVIYDDVEIGDDCWIGPSTTIFTGARLGKGVKVFPGASVAAVPQDLKFDGEYTTCTIGDYTTIREAVTISRGTKDKYTTSVGSHCLLMAYVHIAHDCEVGNYCILANAVQLAGHVVIEDNAIIGGTSAIHQFVRVGRHVMVSGGSLVTKDVPPFTKAARSPLSYAGINSVGLRRRGFSNEKINEIQDLYRVVFQSGYNNSQALDFIELNFLPTAERDEVIQFIRTSERGVMRSYGSNGKED